jgi:CHAT domain-containing protein
MAMSLRAGLMLGFAAAALAAGPCRAAESGATPATQARNLSGETCNWAAPPVTGTATMRTIPIRCGDNNEAAGQLWIVPLAAPLPEASAARRAAIARTANALPGRVGSDPPMTCDAGAALVPDGDRLLFSCTLQSTGWPRILVVAVVGNTLYRGDGMPTMLPVLQAGIAALSQQPIAPAEAEAGLRLVGAKFPGALERAGGAEVASYKALVEIARLDGARRNYERAEAGYRRALEIEERIFGDAGAAVGETLAELGLQVSNQGRFDEAAGLFRRAQPIIDASSSIAARARLASYLALDAANRRHYDDALKFARQATEMRRGEAADPRRDTDLVGASQSPAGRAELAHSLRIEAMMALRVDDLPSALAAAEEVLRIVSEEPGLPLWWRPDTVMMMADVNARLGRVVEAERQYREAIAMNVRLFGESAATVLAELKLGGFYTDQQLYPAAVPVFRQALAILNKDEAARASITPDEIVPFLVAGQALAKADAQQRDALQAEMFRSSQLIGSDVTGRTIARAAARLAVDNTALGGLVREAQDAQRARDEARIELAAETAKLRDERNAARERQLAESMRTASVQADALAARIRTAFPDYAKFANPGPADLAELRQALGPNEAFFSFVVGQKSSIALLVTQAGLTVRPLDVTQTSLDDAVGELRQAFVPQFGAPPEFDLRASFELYRKLLGAFEAEMARVEHLVVVPSGALASLPFALLATAPPKPGAQRSYATAPWLLRRMAVSQVPSARAFLTLRAEAQHATPAPKPLLAVGNPSFVGAAAGPDGSRSKALVALSERCQENGPIPGDLLRALPPLKETASEVLTIGRLLGAGNDALLFGANATETNLRAQPLDQYAVLYFATHGLLPGELHCQTVPGLVLSPPATPARTAAEDGLLDASEIAALKLNADLVVLSACNTATRSGQFGGEALAGLADAFLNAGARMVLASHWEVPSLATVKLMTGLFAVRQAERGRGLAYALRQSQLALIAEPATSHPYDWAAFTIIGDGGSASAKAAEPASPRPREGRT